MPPAAEIADCITKIYQALEKFAFLASTPFCPPFTSSVTSSTLYSVASNSDKFTRFLKYQRALITEYVGLVATKSGSFTKSKLVPYFLL